MELEYLEVFDYFDSCNCCFPRVSDCLAVRQDIFPICNEFTLKSVLAEEIAEIISVLN